MEVTLINPNDELFAFLVIGSIIIFLLGVIAMIVYSLYEVWKDNN